jgi:DHA2 family methylenomycin A resistance protein-like MFS transporter
VFGGLLTRPDTFVRGVHTSLLIAAGVLALTTVLALFLPTSPSHQLARPSARRVVPQP